MMGPRQKRAAKLFYTGVDLDERVPADHPLRRVRAAVSFERVRPTVASCYGHNGQVSVDPVVVLKLMLLVFIEDVRSERELMRVLPMRLDWLWFLEMDLDDEAPDHSVLSKARRLWGLAAFEALFADMLGQCVAAGLVGGDTVHADSTVLGANASVDSRVARKLWEQLESGLEAEDDGGGARVDASCDGEDRAASCDRVDAVATDGGEAPAACRDAAVADGPAHEKACDHGGFVVHADAAPAAATGAMRTPPPAHDTQADRLPPPPTGAFNARTVSTTDPDAATTKRRGKGVTLGYRDHCLVDDKLGIVTATIATAADYDDATLLEPLLDEHRRHVGDDPTRATGDCAYGTKANVAMLRERRIKPYLKPRASKNATGGWLDRMPAECPRGAARRWLGRRLAVSEGRFGDAKTRHGHGRCRWRRRWAVQVQCYLVATAQNLLKLARHSRRRPSPPAAAAAITAITATVTITATVAAKITATVNSPSHIAAPLAADFLRRLHPHLTSSLPTTAPL